MIHNCLVWVDNPVPSHCYFHQFVPPVVALEAHLGPEWQCTLQSFISNKFVGSRLQWTELLPQWRHLICQSLMTEKFARECQYHKIASQAVYHTDGKSSLPEAGGTGCQYFPSFSFFFPLQYLPVFPVPTWLDCWNHRPSSYVDRLAFKWPPHGNSDEQVLRHNRLAAGETLLHV